MISNETRCHYKLTVGIECHVQFKTATKLFSAASNDARQAAPNSLVSHIDFGLPGALPVLNVAVVELAIRAAFALNTKPQKFSKFDRKHYFYPDLPMGYQITQYDQPIIIGGKVKITAEGKPKTVHITRAHIEADAGKSSHLAGRDYSLIDLNRAGTPLLEIVSEPDMHSAAEAKAYARELYLIMRYADVSDANMFYGNMRFDVNVSVSKTEQMGTRTETKNLNSFRSVEKAVNYELNRQVELLERGQSVTQETRGWDDAKQKTFSQRTKENADDYRYMPDPDLPPIVLNSKQVEFIKKNMPIMPDDWRTLIMKRTDLDTEQVEILLDANIDNQSLSYLDIIKQLETADLARYTANWLVNIEIPLRRTYEGVKLNDYQTRIKLYSQIYKLIKDQRISSTNAKAAIIKLLKFSDLPDNLSTFLELNGYMQDSNQASITKIVDQVLAENPSVVDDVRHGELKAISYLIGQVMKLSNGQANPQMTRDVIKKQLGD